MHGRTSEVVETLGRRHIDTCCAQESGWKGCSARLISVKGVKYKFIWSGDNSGFGGVDGNFCSEAESLNNVYSYPGGQINYKHLQCLRTPNWFIIY